MIKSFIYIKKLVLIALLGATLNAFKFILMLIPNVEVVTLLIVAYTYVFGLGVGMSATILFCALEGLLFGFDPSWLLAYFIHWPTVSLVAFFVKKSNLKNPLIIALIFSAVTAMFGFQSTFMYMVTGGAIGTPRFFSRYITLYYTGLAYYGVHIASSFVSIFFGFEPIADLLKKLGIKYFGNAKI